MRVVLAGGTGFIGRPLVGALLDGGHAPAVLTRDPARARTLFPPSVALLPWTPADPEILAASLAGVDAVENQAGESIGAGRWTGARRRTILESRIRTTSALTDAYRRCSPPPSAFLQASAVGFYGDRGDALLDEGSGPGTGFLPEVARAWEAAAGPAAEAGARSVFLRFGVVLARDGGALPRMALPFRFSLGGFPGSGRQYVSWVHRDDAVRAILFVLGHAEVSGPVNVTAPHPLESRLFYALLGRGLRRRCWLRQPAWLLRLALGRMADELLCSGQRVLPRRLGEAGFEFAHPRLGMALRDLYSR